MFTNVVGMFSIGRAPFVAQHEHIFSTIYKGSRMEQEIVAITLVRPDVAIVDTLTELVDAPHRPPGVELIDGAVHRGWNKLWSRMGACGRWRHFTTSR